ncbi:MAG: hypothetical protein PHP23_15715 [Desulfobacterales bacterium]|nr:hypothetical protein [Desulfobacterales bacterium]MDD4072500.1 hypothetical protein [Desulfobacterales bacterium]MDD4391136.1 hypothetical protein [Desulfobacterales bacterium]
MIKKIKQAVSKQLSDRTNLLKHAADILIHIGKFSLFLVLILIGIWSVGRIFEIFSHNAVFEPPFIYGYAQVVWVFLFLFFASQFIKYIQSLIANYRNFRMIVFCIWFAFIVIATVYVQSGYRIAVNGIFSGFPESAESSRNALFELFKYHPSTPLLPINLLILKIAGTAIDPDTLTPFAWGLTSIFAFFIWSVVFGGLLLMLPGRKTLKITHLILAVSGLILTMLLKTSGKPPGEELILLHAGTVFVLIFQILTTFSCLRHAAIEGGKDGQPSDMPFPSTIKLAVFLLIIVPLLSDLQNQFTRAPASDRVIKEQTTNDSSKNDQFITATRISIHKGPADGDDIVATLPRGTRITILDQKFGWVSIGKNQWILPKYLSPDTRAS